MGERPRLGTSRRSFGPVFDQRAGFPSTTCTPLDSPSLPLSFPACLQHSFSLPPDWHTKEIARSCQMVRWVGSPVIWPEYWKDVGARPRRENKKVVGSRFSKQDHLCYLDTSVSRLRTIEDVERTLGCDQSPISIKIEHNCNFRL